MTFNHYAKIKRILAESPDGWYIRRINQPTKAKNFQGEMVEYDHYYRIFDANDDAIKYCKFQKIDKLAQILRTDAGNLPIVG